MRRASIAFFLGDPAFLSDAKFRALARRLPDPDDFNAAVGAFWIVVAAARRNGSPTIDAEIETGSRFIADLRAVGLLTDTGVPIRAFEAWAPMSAQQANAGKERAKQADERGLRDAEGRFIRTPISAPSEASALDPLASADQPSPPLPSTPRDGGLGETSALDGVALAETWLSARHAGIAAGSSAHTKLVQLVDAHGAAAVIHAMERLGPQAEANQYVFGAVRVLRPIPRAPDLGPDPAEAKRSLQNVERTRREAERLQSIPSPDKPFSEMVPRLTP